MRVTCGEVFQDINDLISDGKLNVDGQDIALELFLQGNVHIKMHTSNQHITYIQGMNILQQLFLIIFLL